MTARTSRTEDTDAEAISVSEAVSLAQGTVARIPNLLVVGEVSGFRGPNARSGHCYFELKDEQSSMSVIVWRGTYAKCGFRLKDGLRIQMRGKFDVYATRGSLSFKASDISLEGEGALRQQVAQLARRLQAEGLMDESRKRQIPRFCTRVAVVTSLSGSVIEDVKRTLARRNPLVEVLEAGCSVQGSDAPATIIRALHVAAAARPDVILLVRGGGSFEDLMCFNDEALARAVAACPVPVVTGIGHEPDVSICDMVADRRQSTPSTAAESVALPLEELVNVIDQREMRLRNTLDKMVNEGTAALDVDERLMAQSIMRSFEGRRAQVDALASRRCLTSPLAQFQERAEALELSEERLHGSLPRLMAQHARTVEESGRRLADLPSRMFRRYEDGLARSAGTLEALSPLKVLSRGYSIVRDQEGHVVGNASKLQTGDQIGVTLGRGSVRATVDAVEPAEG